MAEGALYALARIDLSRASQLCQDCLRPPAVSKLLAIAAIRLLKRDPSYRERHQERATRLKRLLTEAGLPVMPSQSHVVPLLVGDAHACRAISDELLQRHAIYVQPINYPTVPRGSERLRLTPSPLHDDATMDRLVAALRDVWSRQGLRAAS